MPFLLDHTEFGCLGKLFHGVPGIIQRKFLELHSCALCDELWKKVAGETAFILRVPVKAILVHDVYSFIILSSFHSLTKFFLFFFL